MATYASQSSETAHPQGHEMKAVMAGLGLILLVAFYFGARTWWIGREDAKEETASTTEAPFDRSVLPIITAADLDAKIRGGEPLVLIDIRPSEAYHAEHIPDSLNVSPEGLLNYNAIDTAPVVIIPSFADEDATRAAYDIVSQKSGSFFFLEGGLEGWRAEGYSVITQGDPNSFIDQSKVTYISPEELKGLLTANEGLGGLFLLDVQSAASYARVHLVGSHNIPLDELEKRRKEIPAGRDIVVYGENELASFQGGVRLSDLGFFSVRTLTGNAHLSPSSPLFREP